MKHKKRSLKAFNARSAAERRQERPRLTAEPGGYGLPLFPRVFFTEEDHRNFRKIWRKIRKEGYSSLSEDERRRYDGPLSAIEARERFAAWKAEGCTKDGKVVKAKDCLPERKHPGIKDSYHPGIRATPHGVLIPGEITTKDYRRYFDQINQLRRKYYSYARLPRGRRRGGGYTMPLKLQKQIWKEFVRLAAGDDAARRSAKLDLEALMDLRKRMNWTRADRILSKKFNLPTWKIRLATFRA